MSENESFNQIRKNRGGSKGKKILLGFLGFIILLVIIGAVSGNSNNGSTSASSASTGSSTNSSGDASSSQSTKTPVVTPPPSANWYPAGYHEWPNDSNVAFKWVDGVSCKQYENSCYIASFISQNGCPSEFYAAINLLDASGSVINYSNGTLPTLQPMQKATLDFEDIDGTSKSAQMSQITCM